MVHQIYNKGREDGIKEVLALLNKKVEEGRSLIDQYDPDPEAVPHDGDPIGRRGPDPDQIGWAKLSVCEELIDEVIRVLL